MIEYIKEHVIYCDECSKRIGTKEDYKKLNIKLKTIIRDGKHLCRRCYCVGCKNKGQIMGEPICFFTDYLKECKYEVEK